MRGDGAAEAFARALEPLRSTQAANHNYTVWFSNDRRVFQRLQWGGCTAVRTRDPDRFGRALALHLSGHGAPSTRLARADGVVAVRDGHATVLPDTLRQRLATYERSLRQAGLILTDAPWVDVDFKTAEIVLEPPRLPPAGFSEAIQQLPSARLPEPVVEPGRYPLKAWYFPFMGSPDAPSTADAVTMVLSGLRWPLTDAHQPLAAAAMFQRVPFGWPVFTSPRELLDHLGR